LAEPRIAFRLTGNGWADIVIESESGSHEIAGISYLSDALDDLVRVGLGVATHSHFNVAQFFHEPGSTIFIAELAWIEGLNWRNGARISTVRGSEHDDELPSNASLLKARREFWVNFSSPDALARAILLAAEHVETEHGLDGYKKLWGGARGFPLRAVAALRAALGAPQSESLNYGG
jgi:hypothetical protein